jgi:uncharacterized membrane protein
MTLPQTPTEWILETLGWIGMILIVLAYAMKRKLPPAKLAIINFTGSVCLGIMLFAKQAWPGVTLQVIWCVISIIDLRASLRSNKLKS